MKNVFMKILTVLTLGLSLLNGSQAYGIAPYHIFDLDYSGNYVMNSESIYQKQGTFHDYNSKVQSMIVIFGIPAPFAHISARIGAVEGSYLGKQAIIQNNQLIGYIMAYNYTTVTSGHLKPTYIDFEAGYGLNGMDCYIQ